MTASEIVPAAGQALATNAEAEALASSIQSSVGDDEVQLPRLKLVQGQSREAQEGLAEPGEYVNSLTGDSYGDHVQFVVGTRFKGRFWSDEDGNGHPATGEVIPWPDHPDVGKRFDESADAEEQYRAAVNAGEQEWGSGPGISTTYNYVGWVIPEDGEPFPATLSLMRSATKAAQKLDTFITRLSKAPWDYVYTLTTQRREKGRHPYFVPVIERGDKTDVNQVQAAIQLGLAAQRGQAVTDDSPESEKPVAAAPRGEDALDV